MSGVAATGYVMDVPLNFRPDIGEEFLIRVRATQVSEETIEVTSYGDPEPRVAQGRITVELQVLATRRDAAAGPV